jgi:hypothetical protein
VLELACHFVDFDLEYPAVIGILEFCEFLDYGDEISAETLDSIAVRSSGVIEDIRNLAQREWVVGELCHQQRVDVTTPQSFDVYQLADQLLLTLRRWSIFREMVVLDSGVVVHNVDICKTVKAFFPEPDVDMSGARTAFGFALAEICRVNCLSMFREPFKCAGTSQAQALEFPYGSRT